MQLTSSNQGAEAIKWYGKVATRNHAYIKLFLRRCNWWLKKEATMHLPVLGGYFILAVMTAVYCVLVWHWRACPAYCRPYGLDSSFHFLQPVRSCNTDACDRLCHIINMRDFLSIQPEIWTDIAYPWANMHHAWRKILVCRTIL